MKTTVPGTTLFVVLASFTTVPADEKTPDEVKAVHVTSLEQAKSLVPGTTSVYVHWRDDEFHEDEFIHILTTLAGNPRIRQLSLYFGAQIDGEPMAALRKFQSLESLEVIDARTKKASLLFDSVAAMKNLKEFKFTYL